MHMLRNVPVFLVCAKVCFSASLFPLCSCQRMPATKTSTTLPPQQNQGSNAATARTTSNKNSKNNSNNSNYNNYNNSKKIRLRSTPITTRATRTVMTAVKKTTATTTRTTTLQQEQPQQWKNTATLRRPQRRATLQRSPLQQERRWPRRSSDNWTNLNYNCKAVG